MVADADVEQTIPGIQFTVTTTEAQCADALNPVDLVVTGGPVEAPIRRCGTIVLVDSTTRSSEALATSTDGVTS